jgi:hypothetical protein
MADRENTPKSRPGRNSAPAAAQTSARSPAAGPTLKIDPALLETIEVERTRLMKAESLLHCAIRAMDDDYELDDGDRPYYQNIIEVARELVNQTLEQLDSVNLAPMIKEEKGGKAEAETREDEHGSDYPGVREPRAEY